MSDQDKKALEDIEKFGCHILSIFEDEHGSSFSYSIGIQKTKNQPELIIQGLKQELSHQIINDYNNRLKNGEVFIPGEYYGDFLEGFDVCFLEVDEKYYDDYFGWAKWLYKGKKFKVLQLVWPTTQGLWPWDEHGSEYYAWAQPLLGKDNAASEI